MIDVWTTVLIVGVTFLWAVVCWSIGFKAGRQEGYTAGYMKGRKLARNEVIA